MLTQATPAIVKALQGVLPPTALKQLTQALGNCNQPLTHRGDVNFQPNYAIGNVNGVYGGKGTAPWNPRDYQDILPGPGVPFGVAGGGGGGGSSTSYSNYQGNAYDFSSRSQYDMNYFYGGNTFNVGGDISNNYSTYNNNPNGPGGPGGPRGGYSGPPGSPGATGADGRDGIDGVTTVIDFFGGGGGGGGGNNTPRWRRDTITVPQRLGIIGSIGVPTNAVSGVTVEYSKVTDAISGVTHNAISGGKVSVPVMGQAISDVQGTVTIPAPDAPTVTYSKATGISGGSVSVPTNAISGGTVTYDKATGVSGTVSYDKATSVSGTATITGLPAPQGNLAVGPSATVNVRVVTDVSATFDATTCTVKLTPTYTTLGIPAAFSGTFYGIPPGAVTASLSGASLGYTSTSINLSGATISTTPTAVTLSGTAATTNSASVTGLGLTYSSASATVTGGFAGNTYKIDTSPTYASPTTQDFFIDGVAANITGKAASTTTDNATISLVKANYDQRAVCTGFAEQAPIVKTFYAP